MIDLELLRQKPQLYKDSLKKRFQDESLVDNFLELDKSWRDRLQQTDNLRARQNLLSKTKESAEANKDELKKLKADLSKLEEDLKAQNLKRSELAAQIPNLIDPTVGVGEGESANQVIKTNGEVKLKAGQPHDQLMTALGWLDLETAAKVSGARFRYLKGPAALAEMKLMQLAFTFAVEKGFLPVIPPVIVRTSTLEKGGFFPGGKADTFSLGNDLYLVGTSEYSLVGLAMQKTYRADDLPVRLVGFSTCFRQETGSYGKDTKGMFRQHQFDKVEMVSITTPENSASEHEFLLSMQEEFVSRFDLPYRVSQVGSGDLEAKATKRYDLEVWFPGSGRYRETHSVSNCTDYQARGLEIKYQTPESSAYAHTLNGTLVTERLLLALIENNQTADGQVRLPRELQ